MQKPHLARGRLDGAFGCWEVIPAMLSYKPIGDLVLRAELLLVGCVVPDFAVALVGGYSDFIVI